MAGVVTLLLGGWFLLGRTSPPVVDKAQEQSMLPAIHEQLERGPWEGMLRSARPDLVPRWFCSEHVIEIRPDGPTSLVGLQARCQEFGRDGGSLVEGSGESGPQLVTLLGDPGNYRVGQVRHARDGSEFTTSVRQMFSPAGAAEALRLEGNASGVLADPAVEARRLFGLPPDAPITRAA